MIKLNREDIKYLLKVAIFIALFVVAIRFFIYLLPFIFIALVVMLIYDSYKRNQGNKKENSDKKIPDAEVISERKNY